MKEVLHFYMEKQKIIVIIFLQLLFLISTISGTTVSIVGSGSTVITASQASDSNYNSATVTASLTVVKDNPIIELSDVNKTFNDEDFSLSATSSSTGAISYSSSDTSVATISGTTVTIVGSGSTVITASQASDSNYNSATVTASLTVAKDDPILSGLVPMTKTFNDVDFSLSATSSSTVAISYSSSDTSVATISGTTVTIVGSGSTVITASQASDSNYNSATVTASLTVVKDNPIIELSDVNKTFNDEDFSLSATSSSTGIISYSSSDTSVATISGTTVTIVGSGLTVITASQASDSNYNSATVTASLTVVKDNPIIELSDVNKTFNDEDFSLSATSSSTGAISYSSNDASVATISGTTVTIVGAGSAVIEASQAADSNYNSTTVTASITVEKDDPVISGFNA